MRGAARLPGWRWRSPENWLKLIMVEAAISVVAEMLLPLFLGIFEVAAVILVASIRPWRYVLSPSFRAKTNADLAERSALQKGWHLASGSLAIAGSMAIVAAGISIYRASVHERHDETKRERIVQKAEELLAKRGHRASEAAP